MKVPKPDMIRKILEKNKYNRLGLKNFKIRHIVWYKRLCKYEELWAFFNGIPYNKIGNKKFYLNETAHFIINKDGVIIQCLPLDESCIYSGDLIDSSINIVLLGEEINKEQYKSMVNLGAWICNKFKLDPRKTTDCYNVICSKEDWVKFKRDQYDTIKEFKNKLY